jgi:hypothetical protein
MDTPATVPSHSDLATKAETKPSALAASRMRRAAALKAAEGLWKDRTDIPKDGVEYQNQLRAEWP